MTAQSPSSYFLSALMHGAIAGLLLFFAYTANRIPADSPKIMELVAGSGDNYGATEAPALGVAGGIKVRMPAPLPPLPAPVAPAPEPPAAVEESPVTPPPLERPIERSPLQKAPVSKNEALAKPARKTAPKAALRPPNFLADLKRLERKREARLEARYQKQLAARAAAAAKITHIDAEGIREGVIGGSAENTKGGAEGTALTREEADLMESYNAFLKQRLKVTFNELKPQDVSDSLSAKVEFMLAADGSISGAHIEKSSGNAEFDRAVLECLAHTRPVGPRPDHRSDIESTTFKMSDDSSP